MKVLWRIQLWLLAIAAAVVAVAMALNVWAELSGRHVSWSSLWVAQLGLVLAATQLLRRRGTR
jgi:hypothetical protein